MVEATPTSAAEAATAARNPQRVVVGVDGSDGSRAAMDWALNEARLRGVTLHAVLGWGYHPSWAGQGMGSMFPLGYTASGGMLPGGLGGARMSAPTAPPAYTPQSTEADVAAVAHNLLDAAIRDAVGDDADSWRHSVKITRRAVQGSGAKVLLDEVTESDLLVVGSRGHGGFVGALLGSVSHHVVSQARCPVVVVPHGQSAPRAE